MGAVWYYTYSNPAMSRMGQRTLERIFGRRTVSLIATRNQPAVRTRALSRRSGSVGQP